MTNESFFKCVRSDIAREVAKKPGVLMILFHLALVTPRTGADENKWVKVNYRSFGLTREQFRYSLAYISNHQLATSRTTNRGTWIKLTSKSLFDINESANNQQNNQPTTSLYIQEERINNTYKQTEPKKELITASTITEENAAPFQNVSAKVSLAERSDLEQELRVIAIKGGKSHRFTKSQLDEIGRFDKASVIVCMNIAVACCKMVHITYSYFKPILEQHALEKGTVTITERPRVTELDIMRQAEADGYKPRPLPVFPVTEKSYV